MGPAAAWAVPAGVGLFGTLFGSHQQQQGAQQAASGQTAINQILAPYAEQLLNEFQSNYAGLEPSVTGGLGSTAATAGSTLPINLATYLNELVNPQYLQGSTGIPLQQGEQSAYGYFMNPAGTTLQSVGGDVLNKLQDTMHTGIDPKIISNILGQYDTSEGQTISNIRNQLGAGIPNLSGTVSDIINRGFANRAGLLSNLGAQSQGLELQAAGQIPGVAGGIDAQTQQMIMQALGIGTSAEQQRLGQEGTAVGTATGIDQLIQQIISSGASTATPGLGVLGNIGQAYGAAGAQIASQPNPWMGLANTLSGVNWPGSSSVTAPIQQSQIPEPWTLGGPSSSYTPGQVSLPSTPTFGGSTP